MLKMLNNGRNGEGFAHSPCASAKQMRQLDAPSQFNITTAGDGWSSHQHPLENTRSHILSHPHLPSPTSSYSSLSLTPSMLPSQPYTSASPSLTSSTSPSLPSTSPPTIIPSVLPSPRSTSSSSSLICILFTCIFSHGHDLTTSLQTPGS